MSKPGGISKAHWPPDRHPFRLARASVLIQKQDVRIGGILLRQDFLQREDSRPTSKSNKVWIVGKLWNRRLELSFT